MWRRHLSFPPPTIEWFKGLSREADLMPPREHEEQQLLSVAGTD